MLQRQDLIAQACALSARAIARHPELTTRAERAVGLIAMGQVQYVGHDRWLVHGYTCNPDFCTCPDCEPHTGKAPIICGTPMCKHRLAVMIMLKIHNNVMPEPHPDRQPVPIWQQAMLVRSRIAMAKSGLAFV